MIWIILIIEVLIIGIVISLRHSKITDRNIALEKFMSHFTFYVAPDKLKDDEPYKYLWEPNTIKEQNLFMNRIKDHNMNIHIFTLLESQNTRYLSTKQHYVNRLAYLYALPKDDNYIVPNDKLIIWK